MPVPPPGSEAGMKRVKSVWPACRELSSSIAGSTFCVQGTSHGLPGAKRRCMSTQRCRLPGPMGPCARPCEAMTTGTAREQRRRDALRRRHLERPRLSMSCCGSSSVCAPASSIVLTAVGVRPRSSISSCDSTPGAPQCSAGGRDRAGLAGPHECAGRERIAAPGAADRNLGDQGGFELEAVRLTHPAKRSDQ